MPGQLIEILQTFFSGLGTIIAGRVPETISLYQSTVQWAAIALAALAGVYEARRRELDFFGSLVIAIVVSVGGGTLRDVLLARYPLFWVVSPVYLVTILTVATIGTLIISRGDKAVPLIEPIVGTVRRAMRSDQMPMWVIVVDAAALGLWAYLGTAFALQAGASAIVAPVFGVMTASFGGVIRDVFFAQTPSIFKRGQLYATSAAIGSIVYVILYALGVEATIGFVVCVLITFLVRMLSVRYNILSV
ncbi:MAG: hypothetical protein DCC52_11800 [Chloroflexi bacterium]|nr:MAG: hypothetical protein DCC52_11800 [Chloroflexota bacterium]